MTNLPLELQDKIYKSREFFYAGKTKNIEYRKRSLVKLRDTLIQHERRVYSALKKDLNKSKTETFLTELTIVNDELDYAIKNISQLAKADHKFPSLSQMPSRVTVYKEPYGVCLILSPWNYPYQLALIPVISAVAAGNTVIVKTSSKAPHTGACIKHIIEHAFEPGHVQVVLGDEDGAHDLIYENFDYLFFTGSPRVGKIVMEAASKNLTPVTLELGGKSPVIVDATADIHATAKRIVFGKLMNAGQTCIAPDYIMVDKEVEKELVQELLSVLKDALPSKEYVQDMYPKIITKKHFERLKGLAQGEKLKYPDYFSKEVETLFLENSQQILPTLVLSPSWESPIMSEEIFGPLLPIIPYENTHELIRVQANLEKPLALYVFSKDKSFIHLVRENISSGGGCVNDTLLHVSGIKNPFGGVGNSGMGQYHGKHGFDTFTHKRTIVHKSLLMDVSLRHHPFTEKSFAWLKKIF